VTGRESCASRPRAFCRAARGDRNQIIVLPLETGCRKVRGSGAQKTPIDLIALEVHRRGGLVFGSEPNSMSLGVFLEGVSLP
jgi:hypothetical protein